MIREQSDSIATFPTQINWCWNIGSVAGHVHYIFLRPLSCAQAAARAIIADPELATVVHEWGYDAPGGVDKLATWLKDQCTEYKRKVHSDTRGTGGGAKKVTNTERNRILHEITHDDMHSENKSIGSESARPRGGGDGGERPASGGASRPPSSSSGSASASASSSSSSSAPPPATPAPASLSGGRSATPAENSSAGQERVSHTFSVSPLKERPSKGLKGLEALLSKLSDTFVNKMGSVMHSILMPGGGPREGGDVTGRGAVRRGSQTGGASSSSVVRAHGPPRREEAEEDASGSLVGGGEEGDEKISSDNGNADDDDDVVDIQIVPTNGTHSSSSSSSSSAGYSAAQRHHARHSSSSSGSRHTVTDPDDDVVVLLEQSGKESASMAQLVAKQSQEIYDLKAALRAEKLKTQKKRGPVPSPSRASIVSKDDDPDARTTSASKATVTDRTGSSSARAAGARPAGVSSSHESSAVPSASISPPAPELLPRDAGDALAESAAFSGKAHSHSTSSFSSGVPEPSAGISFAGRQRTFTQKGGGMPSPRRTLTQTSGDNDGTETIRKEGDTSIPVDLKRSRPTAEVPAPAASSEGPQRKKKTRV